MKQYFEKQIEYAARSNRANPLVFYIVNGKVDNCLLSVVDSLKESLTFIEYRSTGALDLPVLARK